MKELKPPEWIGQITSALLANIPAHLCANISWRYRHYPHTVLDPDLCMTVNFSITRSGLHYTRVFSAREVADYLTQEKVQAEIHDALRMIDHMQVRARQGIQRKRFEP